MISCDIEDFDGYNSLKGTSRVFVYLSEQNKTKQNNTKNDQEIHPLKRLDECYWFQYEKMMTQNKA